MANSTAFAGTIGVFNDTHPVNKSQESQVHVLTHGL